MPDLYYFNQGSGQWSDPANWFNDQEGTSPAGQAASSADNATICNAQPVSDTTGAACVDLYLVANSSLSGSGFSISGNLNLEAGAGISVPLTVGGFANLHGVVTAALAVSGQLDVYGEANIQADLTAGTLSINDVPTWTSGTYSASHLIITVGATLTGMTVAGVADLNCQGTCDISLALPGAITVGPSGTITGNAVMACATLILQGSNGGAVTTSAGATITGGNNGGTITGNVAILSGGRNSFTGTIAGDATLTPPAYNNGLVQGT